MDIRYHQHFSGRIGFADIPDTLVIEGIIKKTMAFNQVCSFVLEMMNRENMNEMNEMQSDQKERLIKLLNLGEEKRREAYDKLIN